MDSKGKSQGRRRIGAARPELRLGRRPPRRHRDRRAARLGGNRRGKSRLRDRRPDLRRGRRRGGNRLPPPRRRLQAGAPRLAADRPGNPLLGGRRGLLDGLHHRQPLGPLPVPGRRRLPPLLPLLLRRPRPPRPRPRLRDRLAAVDGRADRRARHRRARRRLHLRLRRRQDDRHHPAGRHHPRLPARRHRHALDGGRRGRADRLAPRPHLVAAAGRALGAGDRRHRLHPAIDEHAAERRLDRPDLPDRGDLLRRRRLAARSGGQRSLPRAKEAGVAS